MIFSGDSVPGAGAETTGRYVVVFDDEVGPSDGIGALNAAGLSNVAASRDFATRGVNLEQVQGGDGVAFAELGVAVVSAEAAQVSTLRSSDERRVLAVEPELVFHTRGPGSADYFTGYRDAVADLASRLAGSRIETSRLPVAPALSASFADTASFTWGLQASCVTGTSRSGRGIKVAVLDTGLDLKHPDFAGRSITSKSFVPGEEVQDGNGHGTHCAGTSCGLRLPDSTGRYGVACEADLLVGKVLGDRGSGGEAGILAGIDWALTNGAQVISMSLGADTPQVNIRYEKIGSRALAAGSLIIAAAGNNARRPRRPGFVGTPANSPSVMAVAAVDANLDIAEFSASSTTVDGGKIDIAGPGVDVFSSWPMPTRYRSIDGTSMATPHVSGLAALWTEATGRTGRDLWATLTQNTRALPLPSSDVGSGLAQAPA